MTPRPLNFDSSSSARCLMCCERAREACQYLCSKNNMLLCGAVKFLIGWIQTVPLCCPSPAMHVECCAMQVMGSFPSKSGRQHASAREVNPLWRVWLQSRWL